MKNKQANTLFIPTSVSGSFDVPFDSLRSKGNFEWTWVAVALQAGIREDFETLGNKLAASARRAYQSRQMETVDAVSSVMLTLPLSDSLQSIARYYQAILLREHSPRPGLELLLAEASVPLHYKARILQTLCASLVIDGDLSTAAAYAAESTRIARDSRVDDPLTIAEAAQQIAIIQSIQGEHRQALDSLEKVFPLFRAIARHYPLAYYDFLNSLAVELSEVGRHSEAQAVCKATLSSPFAALKPHWRETYAEIALRELETRAVASRARKVLTLATTPKRLSVRIVPRRSARSRVCQISGLSNLGKPRPGIICYILVWITRSIGSRSPPDDLQKLTATRFTNISRNVGRQSR